MMIRPSTGSSTRRPATSGNWADSGEAERFDLPYCSRCTEVIVADAVNNVIDTAQEKGHLADRIDREYLCYLPDKARGQRSFIRR